PKVLSTLNQMHQMSGSSSSSPGGNGFITKEVFGAQISSRMTPVKTLRDAADRGVSNSRSGDGQKTSHPDPFLSIRPAQMQHRGMLLCKAASKGLLRECCCFFMRHSWAICAQSDEKL
ncbi:hypothetical protein ILYODFUR_033226, partial [Ilyodon furcidens]